MFRTLILIPILISTLVFQLGCSGQETSSPEISSSEFRNWTSSSGKQSETRMKLIEVNKRSVRLEREDNGKVITLQKTKLSDSDIAFIDSQTASSKQTSSTDDWQQWRGPNRDGKSGSTGLLQQWPDDGPKLAWNVTGLGEGYSTPAVVGDEVFVQGTRGGDEILFALSATDGSKKWERKFGTKTGGGGYPGPKGTPTIEDDAIYVLGGGGSLACINRDGSDIVWSKNLKDDFAGQHGGWHYAESPLIDGNKLICTPGGANTLIALNKSNGNPLWKSGVAGVTNNGYARAGYASPIKATVSGVDQYIAFIHGGVVGVDAKSGNPLWHYDSPANGTANCSTPVVHNNSVFAASAYGTGGGRAELSKRGNNWNVNEKYFLKKMENHHGGFVLHDGHIYGTNNGTLLCIEWESGAVKWQDRCVGKGSITFADGHLYVRSEGGDIALVEATPNAYREKGRFKQPDRSGKNAWAHPVIAGNRLYLHDQDRMLCYELK